MPPTDNAAPAGEAPEILSCEQVAEMKGRADLATPAPWTTKEPEEITSGPAKGFFDGTCIAAVSRTQRIFANPPGGIRPEFDRRFIAHARTDVPSLAASHETLRARVAALEDVADRFYIAASELCHLFEDLHFESAPVLWKCYEDARFALSVHNGNKGGDVLLDTRGKRAKEFDGSDACKARWATFYEAHRESFGEVSRKAIEASDRYRESLAASVPKAVALRACELREAETCPECDGTGTLGAFGRDSTGKLIACETCHGHEDRRGYGFTQLDSEAALARALAEHDASAARGKGDSADA